MPYSMEYKEKTAVGAERIVSDLMYKLMVFGRPAVLLFLLAFMFGCSETESAPEQTAEQNEIVSEGTSVPNDSNETGKETYVPSGNPDGTAEPALHDGTDKGNIQVASPEIEPAVEPELPDDQLQRNDDVTETFDASQPTLMGLSVGAPAESLRSRFGEPKEIDALPDEAIDASIWRYSTFAVGVKDNSVLFVEVFSENVNPGLNGFRLGDNAEQALSALGTPTAKSDYVWSYSSGGSILKLDMDPATETVHSIKLFPEE